LSLKNNFSQHKGTQFTQQDTSVEFIHMEPQLPQAWISPMRNDPYTHFSSPICFQV